MEKLLAVLLLCACIASGQDPLTDSTPPVDTNLVTPPLAPPLENETFAYPFLSASAPSNEYGLILAAPGAKPKSCRNKLQCPAHLTCHQLKCVDPCTFSCGPNTECKVLDRQAICTCLPGFGGDPTAGCTGNENECLGKECTSHDHCTRTMACIRNKCVDPCVGLCKANSRCKVVNHLPVCACEEGYGGNPFVECVKGGDGAEGNGGQGGNGGNGGDGDKEENGGSGGGNGGGGGGKGYKGECFENFPPVKKGKKKYEAHTEHKMDWVGAYLQCMKRGHQLATIDTIKEYEELNEYLTKTVRYQRFWIGGMGRNKNDITWRWWPEEKEIDSKVEKWFDNRPGNIYGNDHCLELWDYYGKGYNWNDWNCGTVMYYVCEYYDE